MCAKSNLLDFFSNHCLSKKSVKENNVIRKSDYLWILDAI